MSKKMTFALVFCNRGFMPGELIYGARAVMYDGSVLSFEENMPNTKMVVAFAKQTGASVEAEIGCMGKRETGRQKI